jgi:hypothetical protein
VRNGALSFEKIKSIAGDLLAEPEK